MMLLRSKGSKSWKKAGIISAMLLVFGLGTALAVTAPPIILDSPEFPPESNPEDCNDLLTVFAGAGATSYMVGDGMTVMLLDPVVKCFQEVERIQIDTFTEQQTFMATMEATIAVMGEEVPLYFEGMVMTQTMDPMPSKSNKGLIILEMFFFGGAESEELMLAIQLMPQMPSTGEFNTTDLGNGQFIVESFFDVWTMITGDGEEWIPATSPFHMELMSVNNPLPLDRNTTWSQLKGMYR